MKDSYECVVMGAGPAGSTAAALLAAGGNSTLLLERERMPRFHVGESLMPEAYWTLRRLGLLERMRRSRFVKKVSVQFITHCGRESQPFFFPDHDPRECSRTWQVERAEFDMLLFENAASKGADCHAETRVLDLKFKGDRPISVLVQDAAGRVREINCRVVVDATGQQSLVARKLGLRVADPLLQKAAIWGYYRGSQRESGDHGGGTLIMHTEERKSWFWYIPLTEDITSIGVVADCNYLLKGRGSPAQVFEDELVQCPGLTDRLMDAQLVSRFHVAKDFSYSTRRQSGDGWVLVGDAFGFLDPIYSSGVFLALRSGELAADAITEGFRSGDLSASQLGRWTEDFRVGVSRLRKLVRAFYSRDFSFGEFVREYPELRRPLTDLLIGRFFQEFPEELFAELEVRLGLAQETAEAGRRK